MKLIIAIWLFLSALVAADKFIPTDRIIPGYYSVSFKDDISAADKDEHMEWLRATIESDIEKENELRTMKDHPPMSYLEDYQVFHDDASGYSAKLSDLTAIAVSEHKHVSINILSISMPLHRDESIDISRWNQFVRTTQSSSSRYLLGASTPGEYSKRIPKIPKRGKQLRRWRKSVYNYIVPELKEIDLLTCFINSRARKELSSTL